ncbi:MAG: hypothetical protein QM752_01085 [Gammaproteobacteria bacterium]
MTQSGTETGNQSVVKKPPYLDTTLLFYKNKLDDANKKENNKTIKITGFEWFRYYMHGALNCKALKTPKPLDKILSFLVLRFPQYIDHIDHYVKAGNLGEEKGLMRKPGSEAENEKLGLYKIFTNIQAHYQRERKHSLDKLVEELRRLSGKDSWTDGDIANCEKYLSDEKQENIGIEVSEDQKKSFEYYAEYAKRIYKKQKDETAELLKTLKEPINDFARELGWAEGRLTESKELWKNPKSGDYYGVIESFDNLEASQYIEKEQKKRAKQQKEDATTGPINKKGVAYSLIRSVVPAFGSWALLTKLAGVNFVPISTAWAAGMAVCMTVCILTTFYSNLSLRGNLRDYHRKGGLLKLLWQDESKVDANKRMKFSTKLLKAILIGAVTLGIACIYAFPLFQAIQGLNFAGPSLLYLVGGLVLSAYMFKLAIQTFLPKVSKFVYEKMTNEVAKNFWKEELAAPWHVEKSPGERFKLFCKHSVPNACRIIFVGGIVAVANWVTFESLTGSVEFTAGAIPKLGLSGNPIVAGFAIAFISLNILGCFSLIAERLHDFGRKYFEKLKSPIDKATDKLDQCTVMSGDLQVTTRPDAEVFGSETERLVGSEQYQLSINTKGVTAWKGVDLGTRWTSSLAGNGGILGTEFAHNANVAFGTALQATGKTIGAATASVLNKFSTKDGITQPRRTYNDELKARSSSQSDLRTDTVRTVATDDLRSDGGGDDLGGRNIGREIKSTTSTPPLHLNVPGNSDTTSPMGEGANKNKATRTPTPDKKQYEPRLSRGASFSKSNETDPYPRSPSTHEPATLAP